MIGAGAHSVEFIDFAGTNGAVYRIAIAAPSVQPPCPLPLLIVLDGYAYFGTVVETVAALGTVAHEIAPAIVVGIGYPEANVADWMRRRVYDLTPAPSAEPRPTAMGGNHPAGGLDALLDCIESKVRPLAAARHEVAEGPMALVGHSLGGIAALYAMFTRPERFDRVAAISPSIWWHRDMINERRSSFVERLAGLSRRPRLFIGVGGDEQTPPDCLPPDYPATLEEVSGMVRRAAMLDHARAMATQLREAGLALTYAEAAGESHSSAPFALMARALRALLPPGRL